MESYNVKSRDWLVGSEVEGVVRVAAVRGGVERRLVCPHDQ
jgi:hypothetical protein